MMLIVRGMFANHWRVAARLRRHQARARGCTGPCKHEESEDQTPQHHSMYLFFRHIWHAPTTDSPR